MDIQEELLFQTYNDDKCLYIYNDLFSYKSLMILVSFLLLYYKFLNLEYVKKKLKQEILELKTIDTSKYLNKDDKYIRFNFIGIDKQYIINWKDYEFMEDNFFSNLVKYSNENIVDYNTDEDYNRIISIFQSIKYRKVLIIEQEEDKDDANNNIYSNRCVKNNLYYILKLLEKWAINDDILNKYIIEKISDCDYREIQMENLKENIDMLSSKKSIYLNNVFKCENCKGGFTELFNHNDVCKYHDGVYALHANRWDCCGNTKDHSGCKTGKHIKIINQYSIDTMRHTYELFC